MKCRNCGGTMKYDIDKSGLVCESCGFVKKLRSPDEEAYVEEQDVVPISADPEAKWGVPTRVINCKQCGASMIDNNNMMSGICPFCGSVIVLTAEEANIKIAPSAVIPFTTTREEVEERFYKWNKFAIWSPEAFRKGKVLGHLVPIYIPYWTFDADSLTTYSGKFGNKVGSGDDAYVKWYKSSGMAEKFIDDYTVCGSKNFKNDRMLNSVASSFSEKDLIPYTPEALAGIMAEVYSIDINEAWHNAMVDMKPDIIAGICKHENAEYYANMNLKFSTEFSNIKYRCVLVPMWLTACRYNGKSYNVAASGFNNRGNCKRPVSVLKIILIVGLLIFLFLLPQIIFFIAAIGSIIMDSLGIG